LTALSAGRGAMTRHYDGALSAGKAFEKAFASYPLSYPLWGTCL
jgi:hypothetical protein